MVGMLLRRRPGAIPSAGPRLCPRRCSCAGATPPPSRPSSSGSAEAVLRAYVGAKDHNRPVLARHAFAADATVSMVLRTDAIAFPDSVGLDAIASTLVSSFNVSHEDIFTFSLGRPPAGRPSTFSCDWLVGMHEKATGDVRVGCGAYGWSFGDQGEGYRATALTITIEEMCTLPPEASAEVFDGWLMGLEYPFTDSESVLGAAPLHLEGLAPVAKYLSADRSAL